MKKALLLSFEFQVALYEINQFGILKNYIKSELNNFYLNVFGFFFFFYQGMLKVDLFVPWL